MGGPITTVKVKFHSDIAPWIRERRWRPSQETKEHDDGSATLTFKVAGTWEIKRWIMSFGSSAKVLEPKELRKEILEEAMWIWEQ
ncbi:MAG: WYL domain-containing protein [Deltaproteobacteria bacterium]|nr:MAG: WYL domain-containing protein [Deltaproteobacteria bacterium]